MGRLTKIIGILVVIIVLGVVAFLGLHYFLSGGQLPLQSCANCHGA